MAQLALFNEGVPGHLPILWLTVALFNEGAPAHFFRLMEAPTMRLPNVKMLLRWPSRMYIYDFVSDRTFFNIMVIAIVPSFRRGRHCRQSEAIVEEGMGPDDQMVKEALGCMSKQGAK